MKTKGKEEMVNIPKGFLSLGSMYVRLSANDSEMRDEGIYVEPYERSFHWIENRYIECDQEECPHCARGIKVEKKRLAALLLPLKGISEASSGDCACNCGTAYKFSQFPEDVDFEKLVELLGVAETALIGIYGFSKVTLDTKTYKDDQTKTIIIDASSELAQNFVNAFIALLTKYYPSRDFKIERIKSFPEVN
ncbi:MAG: hypothetical protein GY854_19270 [Deltaproteobacteria bacterium]|nr:hypothetical protein [Deltaproteobacteria bacterium]